MRRVAFLALIWGWSFLLIEVALRGMSPAALALGRVVFGAVVLVAIVYARGGRLPSDIASWRHFLVMGFLSSALPFTSRAWGQERITSALTSVVNATTPLFAAAFVAASSADRLRRGQVAGLLVALTGVGVAAGVGGEDVAGSSLTGVLAVVLASAGYGAGFAYTNRNLRGVSPLTASAGQLVCATVLAVPGAVITTAGRPLDLTADRVAAIAVLGVVGTGFAYLLNYRNVAELGATRASVVTYLIPVVAVTVGVVVLGEPFSPRILVGGGLVVAGLLLVQERFRPRSAAGAVAAPH